MSWIAVFTFCLIVKLKSKTFFSEMVSSCGRNQSLQECWIWNYSKENHIELIIEVVNLNHLFQFTIYLTTKLAQFQLFCKTFFLSLSLIYKYHCFCQIIHYFQHLTSELMSLLQEVVTVFVGLIPTLSVKKIHLSKLLPITFKKCTASHAKNTLMGKLFRRKKSFSVPLSCFLSPVKI